MKLKVHTVYICLDYGPCKQDDGIWVPLNGNYLFTLWSFDTV